MQTQVDELRANPEVTTLLKKFRLVQQQYEEYVMSKKEQEFKQGDRLVEDSVRIADLVKELDCVKA